MIYLIGSMQNPKVPEIAELLREDGHEVFDDWHCVGPEADMFWYCYEQNRGRTFADALKGAHAQDVFTFDKRHIDMSDTGILVLPAGKSGHLELGYMIGQGKRGYILLDKEPERFDVMYNFATAVLSSIEELLEVLNGSN